AVAGDDAAQGDSPAAGAAGPRVESQAFEGNRKQNGITVAGDPAPGLPDGVKAEIVVVDALDGDAVELDAQRVGEELIGALAVMKGIERDADRVVAGDLFALDHVRAQRARISLADKGHIKVVIIVGEECRRGLAGGRAIVRLALAEVSDRELGLARPAGDEIFQLRRMVHPGNADGGLLLAREPQSSEKNQTAEQK